MLASHSMRNITLLAIAVAILVPSGAWSMPNYARQQGVSCFSCHTQPNVAALAESVKVSGESDSVALKGVSGIKAGVSVHTAPSTQSSWNNLEKVGRDLGVQHETSNTDDKQAQGVSAYMGGDTFYASLSLLNTRLSEFRDTIALSSSPASQSVWFRFAYTPTIAGLNLAMSVFGETAGRSAEADPSTGISAGRGSSLKADSIGLDAQAQGAIGNLIVNLKAMYMNSGSSSASLPLSGETRNLSSVTDGLGASARIGGKSFGLNAAYRTYKGTAGNAVAVESAATIGADMNITDRITLKSQYTSYGVSLDSGKPQDGAFSLWLISGF